MGNFVNRGEYQLFECEKITNLYRQDRFVKLHEFCYGYRSDIYVSVSRGGLERL